jgi:hypothetical protein
MNKRMHGEESSSLEESIPSKGLKKNKRKKSPKGG